MKIALYPGTFDPVTNGHLDVIHRASHIFDKVVVGIARNRSKGPLFSTEERLALVQENIQGNGKVEAVIFDSLTVEFAREIGAIALVRGIRAVSDFEFEFQLTQMNRHLAKHLETIFLMPNEEYFFISSRLIKQVAAYDGDVSALAPPNVVRALKERLLPKNG